MKKYNILLAITALIIASLACQTLLGDGDSTSQEELPPFEYSGGDSETEDPSTESDESDFSFGGESDFPMPDDASNVTNIAGTTNYQTQIGRAHV